MPYKCWEVQSLKALNQKYHKSDEEHNDKSLSRNTKGNNNYYIIILINVDIH